MTGGTSLGLGKFKPQWLAEIGTRRTELFDGQTWSSLPSMNRAKVSTAYVIHKGRKIVLVFKVHKTALLSLNYFSLG